MNNKNKVIFAGAGPGAADLVTLRAAIALENADVVIYAGSLVNPDILTRCRKDCIKKDSSGMDLYEVISIIEESVKNGKRIVRLHTGDPAIYGAISEQMDELDKRGIEYQVIPGVSSVFAAAAELKCELTLPEVAQSVILTRLVGRTPMPEKETVKNIASTGATLAFFLSVGQVEKLCSELKEYGYASDTPAAVAYRVGWPNQLLIRGTLETISELTERSGIQRQALIIIGRALAGKGEKSKLYKKDFSHGYRNTLEDELFSGSSALYAFTNQGVQKAMEISQGLENAELYCVKGLSEIGKYLKVFDKGKLGETVANNWNQYDSHIFIGSAGIAVRMISTLLRNKQDDPAVIVCSEDGADVISLVGGHQAGANRLTRKVARIIGGRAVITTASDTNQVLAFDELAMRNHWHISEPYLIKEFNSALLKNENIDIFIPGEIFEPVYSHLPNLHFLTSIKDIKSRLIVVLDAPEGELFPESCKVLNLLSLKFVLGIGCRKGVPYDDIKKAFNRFVTINNISTSRIVRMATCDLKEDEPGISELSIKLGCPIDYYKAEDLDRITVPGKSAKVREKIGSGSVSEAAAVKSSSGKLVIPKKIFGSVTFALAQIPVVLEKEEKGRITVVGLGSGSPRHFTREVETAINSSEVISGYTKYIDFIRNRINGKEVIESGMKGEIERCRKTMEAAQSGKTVCMVSSGDAGILAMAGLLYELRSQVKSYQDVQITVLPGITAASHAAAALGAPLQNGFTLISLSDLLVPAEEVISNIEAAAVGTLPCVLYNPASRSRRKLLNHVIEQFCKVRGADIPSAIVKHAGRDSEEVWTGLLGELPSDRVDMSSLVLIGGIRTIQEDNILYERRGYYDKYS